MEYLYTAIGSILGLDKKHHLIIIGAGNLGQALANYMNFERRGFIFTGIFDINEKLHGKMIRGIQVIPMEEMQAFVRENDIDIAVLTDPQGKCGFNRRKAGRSGSQSDLELRSCGFGRSRKCAGGKCASFRQSVPAVLHDQPV